MPRRRRQHSEGWLQRRLKLVFALVLALGLAAVLAEMAAPGTIQRWQQSGAGSAFAAALDSSRQAVQADADFLSRPNGTAPPDARPAPPPTISSTTTAPRGAPPAPAREGKGAAPREAPPAPAREGKEEPKAAKPAADGQGQPEAEDRSAEERAAFISHPVYFVHAPKSGGTAIVKAIQEGKSSVQRTDFAGRCQWHQPPPFHIRGGFAVVRKTLDRVRSEFCWVRTKEVFGEYKAKFGATEVWPYTCKMYNDYIAAALKKVREDVWFPHCHMIPQWCYASSVDFMVPLTSKLGRSVQDLHPDLAPLKLHYENTESAGHDPGPCDRFNITTACINATNLQGLHEHFRDDFHYIDTLFERGTSVKDGIVQPWRTPGTFVLGRIFRNDTKCGEKGLRTLLSPTPCEQGPSAPGASKPTCVGSIRECAQLAAANLNCSAVINYFGGEEEGPAGPFPGWCRCVLRGHKCNPSPTKGSRVASFRLDTRATARCPFEPQIPSL